MARQYKILSNSERKQVTKLIRSVNSDTKFDDFMESFLGIISDDLDSLYVPSEIVKEIEYCFSSVVTKTSFPIYDELEMELIFYDILEVICDIQTE